MVSLCRDRNTEPSRRRMMLRIVRRYRAVTLTASVATRTEYVEGTIRVLFLLQCLIRHR